MNMDKEPKEKCPYCEGKGEIVVTTLSKYAPHSQRVEPCRMCDGKGEL